jgi:flavin reductase (DIM6/NTAB) family NADH-FMN oxidoreductase RutF
MKKSIETKLALYPTPVTVIGAMNGDKPTWTLVAHMLSLILPESVC